MNEMIDTREKTHLFELAKNPNLNSRQKSDESSVADTLKLENSDGQNGTEVNIKIKKRRKTKTTNDDRNYFCNICKRAYFSYPALYTHKRNKHNIIPITGKQDIFNNYKKDLGTSVTNSRLVRKYKYSAVENIKDGLNFTISSVKAIYLEMVKDIYGNPQSIFFRENYDLSTHEGYKILKNFEETNEAMSFQSILEGNFLQKQKIDDVLILYLINFFKVTGPLRDLNKLVIKFVILLREYLNIAGWDYKKTFIKYEVAMPFSQNGSYTQCNDCEDIPDLINDFVEVFIKMDQKMFNLDLKEFIDIIKNFCNWLFVNNLTNFKIAENEFDSLG